MQRVDAKYETLLRVAPDPIFLVDTSSGHIREVNERTVDLLGYEQERLVGMDVVDLHPASDADSYRRLFERTLAEGTVRTDTLPNGEQIYLVASSGDHVPVELHAETTSVGDEPLVYTIARDITEWRRTRDRLERQRDLLEVLNQVLRHDLRNDLQIVDSYAELLEDGTEADTREYVEKIRECTTNAVEFTSTAGDLAETIRNSDNESRRIQLTELLETKCAEARQTHPNATVECADVPADVAVSATEMLGSVFRNLLENGIKHNDTTAPTVRISGERHEDTVEIRVADDGPGIPDDRKAQVFTKGNRGPDSDGTGIGLYLVRTLVEGYGGEIRVEDNDPTGSVFVVSLPIAD
jgi:PAS domain S-box-containing protein